MQTLSELIYFGNPAFATFTKEFQMPKYFAYLRVSSVHQTKGDQNGIQAQRDAIEAYSQQKGIDYSTINIFVDAGVSGAIPFFNRPELLKCLESMKSGDILICSSLCRISRDMMDSLLFEAELEKMKCSILSTRDEGTHSNNVSSQLVKRILQSVNTYERDVLRARTSAALQARKRRGLSTGYVPFGFTTGESKALLINSDEVTVAERLSVLKNSGLSLRKIALQMNTEKLFNRNGKRWSHVTVRNIYKSWNSEGRIRYNELLKKAS